MKGKPVHETCKWISLDPVEEKKSFEGDLNSTSELLKLLEYRLLKTA